MFRNHLKILGGLCRTCSNVIQKKGRNPKKVATYEDEIRMLFQFDILSDIEEIHSKFNCDACRRKLDMFKSNKIGSTSDKSKAFSIRGVGTSSENLDKIAVANGFIVFTPKDPNIIIIFGFVDPSGHKTSIGRPLDVSSSPSILDVLRTSKWDLI